MNLMVDINSYRHKENIIQYTKTHNINNNTKIRVFTII